MENYAVRLAKRPIGLPEKSDWDFCSEQLGDLEDGQMLVEQKYISLDPAMRGWMNASRSYIKPVGIGEVMRAGSIGKVIATKGKTAFNEGAFIVGVGGVQSYVITDGRDW
ncbi:MAG: NADP-dependent oxidoreductase, partial [Saprospiraceae bacterium]|nr:NADP-dependent oxidoreductase [Saprospiraceae bacterium]